MHFIEKEHSGAKLGEPAVVLTRLTKSTYYRIYAKIVVGLKYVFNVTSIASAPKETDVPRLGFISSDSPAKFREVNFG